MKTIKHFALALVAVACGLGFTSCDQNNPDDYSDYPQLIVGKFFDLEYSDESENVFIFIQTFFYDLPNSKNFVKVSTITHDILILNE